jgi:hypothetical protein
MGVLEKIEDIESGSCGLTALGGILTCLSRGDVSE